MRGRIAGALLAVVSLGLATARAGDLNIGDKAPPLAVGGWVKGEKVEGFEAGKLYVVEFWATWCGPCRVSIPHLTELQKKHKEVTFIGVSVWEDDFDGVKPFVEDMGDKMDYHVAVDEVPEGKTANDGKMAQGWMSAAGENGIPTAFVVNKEGRIAWIGHPMSMDKPLEKIIAGEWDIAKAASDRKAVKELDKRLDALNSKLQEAGSPKQAAALLPEIESLIGERPELEARLAGLKFTLLLYNDDQAKAAAYAESLAAKPQFADNAMLLNNFAWSLIDPAADRKPTEKSVAVALKLATKACDLTDNAEPGLLDTLALAYYKKGDKAKALELQEKAVKLAGEDVDQEIKDRLEMYRKEVRGGDK
jgi:thiol-disulfide isomerase/thioredoxin